MSLLATGCENTFDTAATTISPSAATTTTTLPTGTTAELLERLVAGAPDLSHRIIAGDGHHELLAELDALWAAARDDVSADSTRLGGQIDAAMALLHSGVDKRRPADADKAAVNLNTLVTSYLAP